MNLNYDQKLKEITTLKWLPWIGNSSKCKILLVGESHYTTTEEDLKNQENDDYTRKVVNDMGVNGNKYKSPFFPNILRLFLSRTDLTHEQRQSFWDNMAFYNFIQTPMETKKGRPQKSDYELGWENFYEMIKVLKPEVCIFLGLSAANHFNLGEKHAQNYVLSYHKWGDIQVGKTKSIHLQLSKSEHTIEIYAIKHPSSRFFSATKWRSFLEFKIPSLLTKIENTIK
jgi:hypothetical protein